MKLLELKIPPPAVSLAFASAMWWIEQAFPAFAFENPLRMVICVLLVAACAFFDLAGLLAFRKARTSINPLKPHNATAFVKSGIYRYSRNPMYLGLLLLLAGWATYLSNVLGFFLLPAFVAYMNRFQIIPEERVLFSKFGADFSGYAQSVRRWI